MTLSQLYYTHSWLPLCIRAELQPDGELTLFKCDEEVDCKSGNIYDLHAVVCYIQDDRKNLVSIVNVGQSYHGNLSSNNSLPQWYIFNDISVSPVIGQEAVWFSLDWKIPCVLYYVSRNNKVRSDIENKINDPVITAKVFTESVYLNSPSSSNDVILPEEIPKSGKINKNKNYNNLILKNEFLLGELVAIDAEFVTLNQEESEIRSDGRMTTIKPVQMAVARISCIRGYNILTVNSKVINYFTCL